MGDHRPRTAALARGLPPPILIGLGANRGSRRWGGPQRTLTAALAALAMAGVVITARSGWYRSAPLPPSGQPWFVNAVAAIDTALGAHALLALSQAVERRLGRVRSVRNAPRVVELDLLDYRGEQVRSPDLILPHPRLHQRRFVLAPLAEIAPFWRHSVFGLTTQELLARLGDTQPVERIHC
jgi:2-amino-4-hydroxy-6-hydroxymethyldihydropteridine diphosphokinase